MNDITRLNYRELAKRYDLGTLVTGGDLQLTVTGDLKTFNGDLQLGDQKHNALHRFVVSWQFNAPMLRTLFDFVFESTENEKQHDAKINELGSSLGASRSTGEYDEVIEKWHDLHQEVGIDVYSLHAYAGFICVVLNQLIRLEWTNLGKRANWDSAGKLMRGYSFAQIIDATANYFRHRDEWYLAAAPTVQQLKSMKPIAAFLEIDITRGHVRQQFGNSTCERVLIDLSQGSFVGLMDATFCYVRALAEI